MEKTDRRIVIFWHICELNNWREVVEDQYVTILSSGLLDRCIDVYVTFLGSSENNIDWLLSKNQKIHLKNYNHNLAHFERLCLNDLGRWSKENDSLVFYFHTKGVSKINQKENVWAWRKMLEYFLIEKHEECINILEKYDTIGGNLSDIGNNMHDGSLLQISKETHKMHYSGNFWWSKTEYLKNLPPIPESIPLERDVNYWICERWILQPYPNVIYKEIFRTEKQHYYDLKPEFKF
jgi:hypothetical protein